MKQEIFVQLTKDELTQLIAEEVQKALTTKEQTTPRYYTRKEVCEMFNICLPTLHNMINDGRIHALKVGRHTLFSADAIDGAINDKVVLKYRRV